MCLEEEIANLYYTFSNHLLGSVWLKEWKSERIENGSRIKNILFSLIFVWLEEEK